MANTITINPAQLVGKLHKAAIAKVNEKWKGKVIIVNTAIDMRDADDPLAVIKDGEYKIICKFLKTGMFDSTKELQKPITEYLRWFAGDDIANSMSKQVGFFKRLFGGKNDLSKAMSKGADGLPMFTVPYTIGIKSGSKQSEEEADTQQKDQAKDNLEAQGIKTDTTDAKKTSEEVAKVSDEAAKRVQETKAKSSDGVLNAAAKSKNPATIKKAWPKIVDSLSKKGKEQDKMTEQDAVVIMSTLANMDRALNSNGESKTEEMKESLNESWLSSIASKFMSKAKALVKKFQERDISKKFIGDDENIKDIGSFYSKWLPFFNTEGTEILNRDVYNINTEKTNKKGQKDVAVHGEEKVKKAILKSFAADLEILAAKLRNLFKKKQVDKANADRKHTEDVPAVAESLVSLKFNGIDKEFLFEASKQYNHVQKMINEDMKKKSLRLINAVMHGKNATANTILEDILKKKIDEKVSKVLSEQK